MSQTQQKDGGVLDFRYFLTRSPIRVASKPISRNCPVGDAVRPQKYNPGSFVVSPDTSGFPSSLNTPCTLGSSWRSGAEAGCKNYCIKLLGSLVNKNHTVRCEWSMPPNLNRAISDLPQGADVEQRNAPILL